MARRKNLPDKVKARRKGALRRLEEAMKAPFITKTQTLRMSDEAETLKQRTSKPLRGIYDTASK